MGQAFKNAYARWLNAAEPITDEAAEMTTIPAIQMLLWRYNNHAALREIDNLAVANSAVHPTSRTTGTTSAKTNCITKCL